MLEPVSLSSFHPQWLASRLDLAMVKRTRMDMGWDDEELSHIGSQSSWLSSQDIYKLVSFDLGA